MRSAEREAVLTELRAKLGPSPGPAGAVGSGFAALDLALPSRGYPRGASTAIEGRPGSGRLSLAVRLVAAETLAHRPVAWIDGHGTLYPPAVAAAGARLDRLLIVRPRARRELLYTAEQILAAGAFGAVILSGLPPPEGSEDDASLHRIRAAAERGRAAAVWLVEPRQELREARLRLAVTPEAAGTRVEVVRGGPEGRVVLLPPIGLTLAEGRRTMAAHG